MSFDLFLNAVQDGEGGVIDRKIVERAFAPLVEDTSSDSWALVIPPGTEPSAGVVSIDLGDEIEGFSVNRPPFAPAFWAALYEVMRQTSTLLYWPGPDEGCGCVANADALEHVDPDMAEELGQIPVLTSAQMLGDYVEQNS